MFGHARLWVKIVFVEADDEFLRFETKAIVEQLCLNRVRKCGEEGNVMVLPSLDYLQTHGV